jgi:hypothetical protein
MNEPLNDPWKNMKIHWREVAWLRVAAIIVGAMILSRLILSAAGPSDTVSLGEISKQLAEQNHQLKRIADAVERLAGTRK